MIRLSHSTMQKIHECERKFQLDKLLVGATEREETEHTVFGTAFGVAIASYAIHQDQDRALYEAWLAYWPELESDKKNQAKLFSALYQAFYSLDDLLQDWEVAFFLNEKGEQLPAVELSFRLNIDQTYYFVGYIDIVLRNKYTGVYAILENKTTGLNLHDLSPLYRHSGQALGYSIVLDKIAGEKQSSYGVIYFVAQINDKLQHKIHVLPYEKSLVDRLNWFITLGLDVEHLKRMEEIGTYPMRGGSCLSYNKPCVHFGTCHLFSQDEPKEQTEDLIEYQFVYDLDGIIQDHLERIS